jgi:hypothetical protein
MSEPVVKVPDGGWSEAFVGFAIDGDPCIYIQVFDGDGEHVRFWSEEELQELIDKIPELSRGE